MRKYKIMIDPGHGGKDSGAIGPKGVMEKDIVLQVSKILASLFSEDRFTVFTTRWADIFVELKNRARQANEIPVDLFISIHCNGAENDKAKGFEIWTSKGKTESDVIASHIFDSVAEEITELKLRSDYSDGDSDKETGLYVLKHTKMPAVLIELGFITNPQEELLLMVPEYQHRICSAIIDGILTYLADIKLD